MFCPLFLYHPILPALWHALSMKQPPILPHEKKEQPSEETSLTSGSAKLTPMFEQYLRIKAEYKNCLLFYRMGDFYELFYDDAITAAKELQITLTARHKDSPSPVPMCGVPWHAAKNYISQLIAKGYHVAVCEQVEDPKATKGLVKREVTQVITPGTVIEDDNLQAKSHNYLAALFMDSQEKSAKNSTGSLAWVDTSTGQWSGIHGAKKAELWQWVQKLAPRELLLPDTEKAPANLLLEGMQLLRVAARSHFDIKNNTRLLLEAQGVKELAALGLQNKPELTQACGALLIYLTQVQRCDIRHLQPFTPLDLQKHLLVDELTERNLEIFVRLNGRKGVGTLWHVLDQTLTPMGGRLLEERLRHPWRDANTIIKHQDVVTFFHHAHEVRRHTRDALKNVFDLERISTRIHLQRATPRDFIALRNSLDALPAVVQGLHLPPSATDTAKQNSAPPVLPSSLQHLLQHWDSLEDINALLQKALVDSPPPVITDGGLFKLGYHPELDTLIDLAEHGEQKLQEMLSKEQESTGLSKLKLGYNRVFGYYFELTRAAQQGDPPAHFVRRQTLANAERFTTTALKELEDHIMQAAQKRKDLEYALFQDIREKVSAQRSRILFTAHALAQLDYWQGLAHVARQNHWTAPEFDDSQDLIIREGRHPVVENIIGTGNFVANDLTMDEQRRLCLLTGPNMAGKSTILRQTALICLLAHMGSFVPASHARIGIMDRIFSRVGASDNLAAGQSTFMVEMMETARILRQSTKRSLVILDEIGRGTSTYDGLALAWAVVEELTKRCQGTIRTLFATHYHELTALEAQLPSVFTMNIAICEHGGEVLFLHRLVPGPSDRSYGVEVARLAGVPMPVVQRARDILAQLEKKSHQQGHRDPSPTINASTLPGLELPSKEKKLDAPPQLPHIDGGAEPQEHPLVRIIKDCDPEHLSPMDALQKIIEWKMLWGK